MLSDEENDIHNFKSKSKQKAGASNLDKEANNLINKSLTSF